MMWNSAFKNMADIFSIYLESHPFFFRIIYKLHPPLDYGCFFQLIDEFYYILFIHCVVCCNVRICLKNNYQVKYLSVVQ